MTPDQLSGVETEITEKLKALKRPSPLTLGEYCLGLLPEVEAREVEAYLAKHPHAAHQLGQLQTFLSDLEPETAQTTPGPIEQIRILLATLLQPGGNLQPALSGLRGDQSGVYQAEDIQVIIDVDVDANDPTNKILAGIVQGCDPDGLVVQLMMDEEIHEAPLDEFGNFIIPGLVPGLYHLIIRGDSPAFEVHIQELRV